MTTQRSELEILVGQATDEGAGGKRNEDTHAVFTIPGNNGSRSGLTVGIVADGVTSRTGGGDASQIAVTTVRQVLEKGLNNGARLTQLEEAVNQANREIHLRAQSSAELNNMSTTLVLAAIEQNQLYILHVGDSRAYLIRNQQAHRLTLDHTWVQEALDEGRISEAEAKSHPNRHVIRRYLGIDRRVVIDHALMLPERGKRQMSDALTLQAGDAILLCSDGLTEQVTDAELARVVHGDRFQPQNAVKKLIQLALKRQEADNITAVILTLADQASVAAVSRTRWRPWAIGALILLITIGLATRLMTGSPAATPTTLPTNTVAVVVVPTATPLPATPTTAPTLAAAVVVTNTAPPVTPAPTATLAGATAITPTATTASTSGVATSQAVATATLAPLPTATPTATPIPPPVVQLQSPADDSTITSGEVDFRWAVSNPSGRPISYLWALFRNGEQQPLQTRPITPPTNNVVVNLAGLSANAYIWRVTVLDASGNALARIDSRFTYAPPPPSPAAPPTAEPREEEKENKGGGGGDNKPAPAPGIDP